MRMFRLISKKTSKSVECDQSWCDMAEFMQPEDHPSSIVLNSLNMIQFKWYAVHQAVAIGLHKDLGGICC